MMLYTIYIYNYFYCIEYVHIDINPAINIALYIYIYTGPYAGFHFGGGARPFEKLFLPRLFVNDIGM